MDARLRDEILSILDRASDMTIATIRQDGYPQATTVSFANDGLDLYFGCSENTQKFRNINRNRKVSLTINLPYANWSEIRGISAAGHATHLTNPREIERAGQLLLQKFPQGIAEYASGPQVGVAFFMVVPTVISVLITERGSSSGSRWQRPPAFARWSCVILTAEPPRSQRRQPDWPETAMENFTPVSALVGGVLIGTSSALLLVLNGRIAGISGILGGLLHPSHGEVGWRGAFLVGLLIAPLLYRTFGGALPPVSLDAPLSVLVAAGLLVGFGSRLGAGCTSGHGVCGIGRGSPRSIAATLVFMATAVVTVVLTHHVIGA